MRFVACVGKEHCNEVDGACRACGRESGGIEETRQLIERVTAMADRFENFEEFIGYVGSKSLKKVRHRRRREGMGYTGDH